MILKMDPGSTVCGQAAVFAFGILRESLVIALGSKFGREPMAMISPVCGSITMMIGAVRGV